MGQHNTVLSTAILIAAGAHSMQTDKGGNAYILHPLRMMMRLRTDDEQLMAIAILHDVVEDCGITYQRLRELGMPNRVVEGVRALTRVPGESYEEFIERLGENPDALRVKREDLRDNSDITRMRGIEEKDVNRLRKYMNAYKRVQQLLREKGVA